MGVGVRDKRGESELKLFTGCWKFRHTDSSHRSTSWDMLQGMLHGVLELDNLEVTYYVCFDWNDMKTLKFSYIYMRI